MSKEVVNSVYAELVPCPFCGSTDLVYQEGMQSLLIPGMFFEESVRCRRCGARRRGDNAISKWNARPS